MEAITRIQDYLRKNARKNYRAESLPPFMLFFHSTNPLRYYNYAIPDGPVQKDVRQAVFSALRSAFQQHGRLARFEFFEAFAPDLPAVLRANGFFEEARQWGMICPRANVVKPMPELAGLSVSPINAASSDEDLSAFLFTQRQGFDPDYAAPITPDECISAREQFRIGGGQGFLGRINGQPVGASQFASIIDGVSEMTGIATLAAFRRRGVASYLTHYAACAALGEGAELLCLTAEDAGAGRVYERIGFQPLSVMLAYADAVE